MTQRTKAPRSWKYLSLMSSLMMVYVLLGTFVLSASESAAERELVSRLEEARTKLLEENACLSEDALEDFVQLVLQASTYGAHVARNDSEPISWTFGATYLLCVGLLTGVGNGNSAPSTSPGKLFCIFYVLLGLPLFISFLSTFVMKFLHFSNIFYSYLKMKTSYSPDTFRVIYNFTVGCAFVIIFILLPAVVFTALEPSWGYLESVFYCFISLSTIGLWDLIPGDEVGQKYRTLYKIMVANYLIVGVIFAISTFIITKETAEIELKSFEKRISTSIHSRNSRNSRETSILSSS